MNLLLLGATGKCGQWAVKIALQRGHQVTVLIRKSAHLDFAPGLTIIRGDVLDVDVLRGALGGQDAVISCLGLRRSSPIPWSKLLSPPDLVTRVTESLAHTMPAAGVRRLVWISAGGVGESVQQATGPVQWLIRQGQIGTAYADLERAEGILASTALDWLAVRPVTLVPGSPTGHARAVPHYRFTSMVRRADVADYMVRAAEQPHPFTGHSVLLG